MKKKFYFIVTILILTIILSAALVGCVPSRPDRFITQILASEKWGIIFLNENGEETSVIARNGNLRMEVAANGSTYLVVGKTSVELYRFKDEVWTYELITDSKQVEQFRNDILYESIGSLSFSDMPDLLYTQSDFEAKYQKIDGKWYERNTKPACFYTKGKTLFYEKNNKTIKYIMDYKIVIPNEAKQAKKDALADD